VIFVRKARFSRSTAKNSAKIPISGNDRDMNPFPHGETAADLANKGLLIFCENRVFADYV
jgi:hypothetical protein